MSRENIEELVQAIHFIAEGLEKLAMISLDVKKEVDSELDSLWLESQQTLTETILTDIEIQEEDENI